MLQFCSNTFSAQVVTVDTVGNTSKSNLYIKKISGDSLSSTFCIVIKNEVKTHYHQLHSESIVVLSGQGIMKLNGIESKIKKGDVIFVPKKTKHSVKVIGDKPLKVISTQAPFFDGTDRIFID